MQNCSHIFLLIYLTLVQDVLTWHIIDSSVVLGDMLEGCDRLDHCR